MLLWHLVFLQWCVVQTIFLILNTSVACLCVLVSALFSWTFVSDALKQDKRPYGCTQLWICIWTCREFTVYKIKEQMTARVAGTIIVPSRLLSVNAALPCLQQSFRLTKREAAPWEKNRQQQRTAAGSRGASQPLALERTIFVPAILGFNILCRVTVEYSHCVCAVIWLSFICNAFTL